MLERERNKEKEENARLRSKLTALEMKVSLLEQQVESERRTNEASANQYQISALMTLTQLTRWLRHLAYRTRYLHWA